MRTLLQFVILTIGSVLVLSGCASVQDEPIAQVEQITEPTAFPTEIPQTQAVATVEATSVDEEMMAQTEPTTAPTIVASPIPPTQEEVVENIAPAPSSNFIFYNSHATW